MGAHSLDLPQSPRDAVFRAMETIVRSNATFQRVVKPISFRTWQGNPEDAKEFTFEYCARDPLDAHEHGRGVQDSGHDGGRPAD